MISVVLPVYNSSKFIEPAVESILQQKFQDFELIIVDDGSTDNSLQLLAKYHADRRLRIIQSQHGGLSRALNLGISEAKYAWIARMDADDIALPERLQRQLAAANQQPHVVAWGTYAYHINSRGKTLGIARTGPTTEKEFNKLRQNGHLVQLIHPTVLLKKEAVLAAGGYISELEPVEELDLFDRMAAFGPTLVIPEPLLQYRVHAQSVSMNRFFYQRVLLRYVVARHRRRLAGVAELSIEQFLEEYQHQPWLIRLRRQLQTTGMFFYRKAGLSIGEGNYLQGGSYLGLSTLLHPGYAIPRVWQQALSPVTRHQLAAKSNLS